MKNRKNILFFKGKKSLEFLVFLFFVVSCTHISSNKEIVRENNEETILIGSWNIQVLGKSKTSKSDILDGITDVISRYDIIAIQEIKDLTGVTMPRVMESLLKKNSEYSYLLSERSGDEQYAFIYRKDKIKILDDGDIYRGQKSSDFMRSPHYSYFKVINGNFNFVLINIHVSPKFAEKEIEALDTVYIELAQKYPKEKDYIVLGDYNADCSYFSESNSLLNFRKKPYHWIINDEMDTNVADSKCTYDRIVIRDATLEDFTGQAGVFYFDRNLKLKESPKEYSDHYPVEGRFYINNDRN